MSSLCILKNPTHNTVVASYYRYENVLCIEKFEHLFNTVILRPLIHHTYITAALWSPCGKYIAVGYAIGDICVWDLFGHMLRAFTPYFFVPIITLAWNYKNDLAVGCVNGRVVIYDVFEQQQIAIDVSELTDLFYSCCHNDNDGDIRNISIKKISWINNNKNNNNNRETFLLRVTVIITTANNGTVELMRTFTWDCGDRRLLLKSGSTTEADDKHDIDMERALLAV